MRWKLLYIYSGTQRIKLRIFTFATGEKEHAFIEHRNANGSISRVHCMQTHFMQCRACKSFHQLGAFSPKY